MFVKFTTTEGGVQRKVAVQASDVSYVEELSENITAIDYFNGVDSHTLMVEGNIDNVLDNLNDAFCE